MPASIGRPFCVWWWSCATRRRRATTPWLSILDFLLLAVFEIQSSSINQSMASSSTSIGSWLACYSQHSTTKCYKTSLIKCLSPRQLFYPPQLNNAKGKVIHSQYGTFEAARKLLKRQIQLFASTEDGLSDIEFMSDTSEQQMQRLDTEELTPESDGPIHFERSVGKSGFISFYGRSHEKKEEYLELPLSKHQSILIWFLGPSVLVASFIFPSLYLRRILSSIFEDSLLTDFLILFFTEALFYCGVAVFVLLIDRLQSPLELISTPKSSVLETTHQWLHRISSVATLVLSLIIPMVTMGLVWPWTGPAASATLAPYLVGIVMQFAFEQYAKYVKSPSWPVIPIVFQVYRLHQLNRAAQLVTALSFTVRGAEATLHNVAINRSLGTLLNVLQFLGVICIWSLSSFLMRFFPSATRPES